MPNIKAICQELSWHVKARKQYLRQLYNGARRKRSKYFVLCTNSPIVASIRMAPKVPEEVTRDGYDDHGGQTRENWPVRTWSNCHQRRPLQQHVPSSHRDLVVGVWGVDG